MYDIPRSLPKVVDKFDDNWRSCSECRVIGEEMQEIVQSFRVELPRKQVTCLTDMMNHQGVLKWGKAGMCKYYLDSGGSLVHSCFPALNPFYFLADFVFIVGVLWKILSNLNVFFSLALSVYLSFFSCGRFLSTAFSLAFFSMLCSQVEKCLPFELWDLMSLYSEKLRFIPNYPALI